MIADTTCYEANVFWNTYEITAKGPQLTVRVSGTLTAQAEDGKFTACPSRTR